MVAVSIPTSISIALNMCFGYMQEELPLGREMYCTVMEHIASFERLHDMPSWSANGVEFKFIIRSGGWFSIVIGFKNNFAKREFERSRVCQMVSPNGSCCFRVMGNISLVHVFDGGDIPAFIDGITAIYCACTRVQAMPLALAMAGHPRLGADSMLAMLAREDIMQMLM